MKVLEYNLKNKKHLLASSKDLVSSEGGLSNKMACFLAEMDVKFS